MVQLCELPDDNKLGLPEVEGPGRDISLSDIVAYYFPEGSYPLRGQMDDKLRFFGGLFQKMSTEQVSTGVKVDGGVKTYPISFWMSVDSLLPLIGQQTPPSPYALHTDFQTLDPKSGEYDLRMRMAAGPTFDLTVNCNIGDFQRILMRILGESDQVETANPKEFGLSNGCQVFKMTKREDQVEIRTLDDNAKAATKTPLLIVERGETMSKIPFLSVRLAIDTNDNCQNVGEFSPTRDLFNFVIKPSNYASLEDVISWNSSKARWRFEGEPAFHVSDDHIKDTCLHPAISRLPFLPSLHAGLGQS